MYRESYNFHIEELIDYYRDIWNGEEKVENEFENEFQLSLLKLDTMLTRMKYLQKMPELDNGLLSFDIINDSFINAKSDDYFRPEDYEKHFLVYSLIKHNDISRQSLIQIIDGFFRYPKIRHNLKFRDIQRTGTGSVRCKTNLRFALFYLREYGLINYFEKGKRSWSLTLPGFLIAASFCLSKADFAPTAYEFNLTRLDRTNFLYYSHFDVRISNAINDLCDLKNLDRVFAFVDELNKDNDLKDITHKIFQDYKYFLERINEEKENNEKYQKYFIRKMEEFISEHNRTYKIDFFKSRFSDLINADRFFKELTNN